MDPKVCILICLVSAAAILSPVTAACPYTVSACTCNGRSLVCRNVDSIPPLASDNKDGNITDLTFISGTLNIIPANGLPANLQTLVFSNVQITSISPDAFNSSSTTLKSVSMSKVTYTEIPQALLKVNSLTELNVSDVTIANWRPDVLQYLGTTLRSVAFVNVGLTSWPEWLKTFTFVNSVDLSGNTFRNITLDTFSNVQNLTSLSLRSTGIDDEANLNAALKFVVNTLQILDISDNAFAAIPKVISAMSKLSTLNISNSVIMEITSDRIPRQLKELDLHRNVYFTALTDNSFPNSSSLEVLVLHSTILYNISNLAFQPLEHLRELYLELTSLVKIPLALTKLNTLQVLAMDNIGLLTCPCPRDDKLVQWYASQKSLKVSGNCQNYDFTIDHYLSNTTGKSPCSGYSRITSNVFLHLCLVLLMGVPFL